MDRGRDAKSVDNLLERKNILIAQIMTAFRDLTNLAAAPADNNASTGQTAYSSMALETLMSGIINSTEDLLSLTRNIRELWVIGTLKPPSAHDGGAGTGAGDAALDDAQHVLGMLGALRDRQRREMLLSCGAGAGAGGDGFAYELGDVDGPAQRGSGGLVGEVAAVAPGGAAAPAAGQGQGQTPQTGGGGVAGT